MKNKIINQLPFLNVLQRNQFMKINFIFCLLLLVSINVSAQEEILPLKNNPVLIRYNLENHPTGTHFKNDPDTISLPFFDDFIYENPFPSSRFWKDSNVFINRTIGVSPPNTGVATFDGLNKFGKAYDPLNTTSNGEVADNLTSKYIKLKGISDKDSVYLSFFLQPQGLGDAPEGQDSFAVEIKDKSGNWFQVFSRGGSSVDYFDTVFIPIKNTLNRDYFYDGFQFRFLNYGNRSGNLDLWNLDYVVLDKGRRLNKIEGDLGIFAPPASILKKYSSMPWKQFNSKRNVELSDNIAINANSIFSLPQSVVIGYDVYDVTGDKSITSTFALQNVKAVSPNEHVTYSEQLDKTSFFSIPALGVERKIRVRTVVHIKDVTDPHADNDTCYFTQEFKNYLAYDDGTAEAGYGLKNSKNGQVAIAYALNTFDTLKAIAIHFNQSEEYVANQYFNVAFWNQLPKYGELNSKLPDEEIGGLKPSYVDRINGFHYYFLDSPIVIFPGDTFYIGWTQFKNYLLNVGLDLNYDKLNPTGPNTNLSINTQGYWEHSQINAAPMIRPVFGDLRFIPNGDDGVNEGSVKTEKILIYPNPTQDKLYFEGTSNHDYRIVLSDFSGKVLLEKKKITKQTEFSLISLPKGIYLMFVEDLETKTTSRLKIVVQ